MTEYIIAENIDDRVISRAVTLLQGGGLLAIPTDTSWSIVCSFHSRDGIKRLRALSGERDEEHFTLQCSEIAQISGLCALDTPRFRLIKKLTPGPYVFILKPQLGAEKALDMRRKELGVRIPAHPVPCRLIEALGQPLYAVTAKRTMTDTGKEGLEEEELLFEGGWEIEAIEGIDLILDTGEERPRITSTILDLLEDEPRLVRQGAGTWSGQ